VAIGIAKERGSKTRAKEYQEQLEVYKENKLQE
jgi:hypothetical protein